MQLVRTGTEERDGATFDLYKLKPSSGERPLRLDYNPDYDPNLQRVLDERGGHCFEHSVGSNPVSPVEVKIEIPRGDREPEEVIEV